MIVTLSLPETVTAQRARLDELLAERADLTRTLERDRAELARLTAEGGGEKERARLRKAIASATEREDELSEAIPLLERALKESSTHLAEQRAADARAEADRLTEAWRAQAIALIDELTSWATDVFAPKRRATTAAYRAAVQAHRESMRLSGGDLHDQRDADDRVDRRAPIRGEDAADLQRLMTALALLAERPPEVSR